MKNFFLFYIVPKKDKVNYIFFHIFLQDSMIVTSVTKSKISVRKKFPGVGL